MNAVLGYGRISTEDQSEYSLMDQKAKIVKHCENKNYNLLEYFEDDGASAKNFNRKAFNKLLAYIKKNKGVIKRVDKVEAEPRDLQYGKFIYDGINNLYVNSSYDDPRVRDFLYTEIYKLEGDEFMSFIEILLVRAFFGLFSIDIINFYFYINIFI